MRLNTAARRRRAANMCSSKICWMTWTLTVAHDAERNLRRFPSRDRRRLTSALREMHIDPFSGDVAQLRAQPVGYRRRVGAYRILFDVDVRSRCVSVQYYVALQPRISPTFTRTGYIL